MTHLDTLTKAQRDAIAYACRYDGGTIPDGRAVEFYSTDAADSYRANAACLACYRVQGDGIFLLVRDPQDWRGNRWHRVDTVPPDAFGNCYTTSAAPTCLQVG
jgi:hypothetical protein